MRNMWRGCFPAQTQMHHSGYQNIDVVVMVNLWYVVDIGDKWYTCQTNQQRVNKELAYMFINSSDKEHIVETK